MVILLGTHRQWHREWKYRHLSRALRRMILRSPRSLLGSAGDFAATIWSDQPLSEAAFSKVAVTSCCKAAAAVLETTAVLLP